jgi:hypothetical protein
MAGGSELLVPGSGHAFCNDHRRELFSSMLFTGKDIGISCRASDADELDLSAWSHQTGWQQRVFACRRYTDAWTIQWSAAGQPKSCRDKPTKCYDREGRLHHPAGSSTYRPVIDMESNNPLNASLKRLARTLRIAFNCDPRRRSRMPAEGKLYLLFQSHDGTISSDCVNLHDTFPGGLAFRSPRLFCVGSHLCLSDGAEAMEVSIEFRREDGTDFVYVVSLGDLEPLPTLWLERLDIGTTRLAAIVSRCRVCREGAFAAPARPD